MKVLEESNRKLQESNRLSQNKLQESKIAHTASTVILVVYSILVIYHGVIGSAVLSI